MRMEELEVLLLAYALGGVFSASTEDASFLGTQTPYMYRGHSYTPAPSGYTPFYINYLGRDALSYIVSGRGINLWLDVLRDAKSEEALSEKGELLEKQLKRKGLMEKETYAIRTAKAKEIEAGIAKRIYEHFPQVFGRKVVAISTSSERAKESMAAFLGELSKHTPRRTFKVSNGGKVDPILRFYDLNKAYLEYKNEGKWKEEVKRYRERKHVTVPLLSQFFTPSYLEKIENQEELADELYEIYTNQLTREDALGLSKCFAKDVLRYYWENKNLSTYLEKGPGHVDEHLASQIAFPLLGDFLVTTERAIKNQDTSANLRFAHAETLIPFASLLKVPGCATQTNDLNKVASIWQDDKVAPMGANLCWVVYKGNKGGDLLIKMLYNEEEVAFPIESDRKPYYKWQDVRDYYIKLQEDLGIQWNGPVVDMVKNYKVK